MTFEDKDRTGAGPNGSYLWEVSRESDRNNPYLAGVAIEVNVGFKLVPTVPTTVLMATYMPATISPYSMAATPPSSRPSCE